MIYYFFNNANLLSLNVHSDSKALSLVNKLFIHYVLHNLQTKEIFTSSFSEDLKDVQCKSQLP
jgi:hypothetical protein